MKNLAKARKARVKEERAARPRAIAKRKDDPPAKRPRPRSRATTRRDPARLGGIGGGGLVASGAALADHYSWSTPHTRAAVLGGTGLALGLAVGLVAPAIGAGMVGGAVGAATVVALSAPSVPSKKKKSADAAGAKKGVQGVAYDGMAAAVPVPPQLAGVEYDNLMGRQVIVDANTGAVSYA